MHPRFCAYARSSRIPLFMPVATNPIITQTASSNGWNSVYRLVAIDSYQASRIARFINDNYKSKVALIIHDNSNYGNNLGESLGNALSNESIQFIPKKYSSNLRFVNEIKKLNFGIIIYAGYYEDGGKLVSELRKNNVKQPIILTDGCFVSDIFDFIDVKLDLGELYVSFISPDISKIEKAKGLIEYVKQSQPDAKVSDLAYAPFAADSVRIIYDVAQDILSSKSKVTRQNIIEYLEEPTHRKFEKHYIVGPYLFNDTGDNSLGKNYIYKLSDSKNKWIFLE